MIHLFTQQRVEGPLNYQLSFLGRCGSCITGDSQRPGVLDLLFPIEGVENELLELFGHRSLQEKEKLSWSHGSPRGRGVVIVVVCCLSGSMGSDSSNRNSACLIAACPRVPMWRLFRTHSNSLGLVWIWVPLRQPSKCDWLSLQFGSTSGAGLGDCGSPTSSGRPGTNLPPTLISKRGGLISGQLHPRVSWTVDVVFDPQPPQRRVRSAVGWCGPFGEAHP